MRLCMCVCVLYGYYSTYQYGLDCLLRDTNASI